MESEASSGVITLVFTDEAESQKLNAQYRGKKRPTDVLSFTGIEEGHLGDLVISIPVAKSQAREYQVSLLDELTRLVIHGTLHLLGYDHERVERKEANRMRRKERELMNQLSDNAQDELLG